MSELYTSSVEVTCDNWSFWHSQFSESLLHRNKSLLHSLSREELCKVLVESKHLGLWRETYWKKMTDEGLAIFDVKVSKRDVKRKRNKVNSCYVDALGARLYYESGIAREADKIESRVEEVMSCLDHVFSTCSNSEKGVIGQH